MNKIIASILFAGFLATGCQQDNTENEALRVPDSGVKSKTTVSDNPITKSQSRRTNSQGITIEKAKELHAQIPSMQKYGMWWDNKSVLFTDVAHHTSDLVYDVVKGQPYFPETLVFIYSTDEEQEETEFFTKMDSSLQKTTLDNRIFIWVHFDENQEVKFVRKLVSDNIKDKLSEAPLEI